MVGRACFVVVSFICAVSNHIFCLQQCMHPTLSLKIFLFFPFRTLSVLSPEHLMIWFDMDCGVGHSQTLWFVDEVSAMWFTPRLQHAKVQICRLQCPMTHVIHVVPLLHWKDIHDWDAPLIWEMSILAAPSPPPRTVPKWSLLSICCCATVDKNCSCGFQCAWLAKPMHLQLHHATQLWHILGVFRLTLWPHWHLNETCWRVEGKGWSASKKLSSCELWVIRRGVSFGTILLNCNDHWSEVRSSDDVQQQTRSGSSGEGWVLAPSCWIATTIEVKSAAVMMFNSKHSHLDMSTDACFHSQMAT